MANQPNSPVGEGTNLGLGHLVGAGVRRAKSSVIQWRMRLYYWARRRKPIDPNLAAFAIYWYRGYGCNPAAIYEEARNSVDAFRGVWIVAADRVHAIPAGVDFVVPQTNAYYDLIARAGVLVNNVNFPNHLVKREGSTHVMTHHGTPLKQMGLDLRGRKTREGEGDSDALLRRCARWDYSVSPNSHTTPIFERVYPGSYESLEIGYPRNDLLANATPEQIATIRAELGLGQAQKVVLYAPTHRDHERGELPHLNGSELASALGPEWVVLLRLHHLYDDPRSHALRSEGRLRDVTAYPRIEELCLAADVLITDYSSIMFDYAVLDRPIVIHAPDWSEYSSARGVYFDLMADPPGVVETSLQGVADALVSGRAMGGRAADLRERFRRRFVALEDGHASKRLVSRVWRQR